MPLKFESRSFKALLVSGALLASAGAASAATATATAALNVRSGPGTQYQVIDTLPEGELVTVVGCTGGWCEISMGDQGSGFANAGFLDIGQPRAPAQSRVIIEEEEPEIVTGLSIGGYWDSRPYYYYDGAYYWGGRWYGSRPGVSGWQGSWRRDYRYRGRSYNERRDVWRQREGDRYRESRRDDRFDGRRNWSGGGGRDRDEGRIRAGGRDRDEGRNWRDGGGRSDGRIDGRGGGGRPDGGDRMSRGGGGGWDGGGRSGGGRMGGGGGDRGDRIGLDRAGGGGGRGGGEGRGEGRGRDR